MDRHILGEVKRQHGDGFPGGHFHDEFIVKGRIPLSLIRYEMTGLDGDVKGFWDRPPLQSAISD